MTVGWTSGMLRLLLSIAALAAALGAETVDGSVLITRKLTPRKVTPAVAVYQRGVAVELGRDSSDDPEDALAFERSHVVIWLEGNPAARPPAPPASAAVMEQIGRRFVPDLLVIPRGGSVSFPNMDPIFHNVFSLSRPKEFDLGNYPKGDTRKVLFARPGIIYVNCHLHPNMTAAIVVAPGLWYAKSNQSGKFAIDGVPPGSYTAVAWHKAAGFYRRNIRVVAGEGARVEFLIPMRADAGGMSSAEGN